MSRSLFFSRVTIYAFNFASISFFYKELAYAINPYYKLDFLNTSVLNKEQRRCMADRHIDSKNRQFTFCFRALLCIDQSEAL